MRIHRCIDAGLLDVDGTAFRDDLLFAFAPDVLLSISSADVTVTVDVFNVCSLEDFSFGNLSMESNKFNTRSMSIEFSLSKSFIEAAVVDVDTEFEFEDVDVVDADIVGNVDVEVDAIGSIFDVVSS